MARRRSFLTSLCVGTPIALAGCLDTIEYVVSPVDDSTFCIVRRGGTERVAVTYDQVVATGEPDYLLGRGYHIEVRLSSTGVSSLLEAYEEVGGLENPDETRAEFYAEGRSLREAGFNTDKLHEFKDGQRKFILGGLDGMSDAEAVANQVK